MWSGINFPILFIQMQDNNSSQLQSQVTNLQFQSGMIWIQYTKYGK